MIRSYWFASIVLLSGISFVGATSTTKGLDSISPTASDHPWTIVTVAPDGSWGAGTKPYIYQAIAEAVSNCKKMYRKNIGCGAQFEAIQAGWVVVIRCGTVNIIAPATTLAAAITLAQSREDALRLKPSQVFRQCIHIVTVNPDGSALNAVAEAPWTGRTISQAVPEADQGLQSNTKD